MVNTCSVVYCKTGYKNRENKEDKIPEKHPVFGFPDSKPNLKAKYPGICNLYPGSGGYQQRILVSYRKDCAQH